MDIFYHFDHTGEALRPGLVMHSMPLPTEVQIDERTTLNRWFPSGVTRFGIGIILKQLHKWALERELELESIRRERFANLPSRYVSVFACQSAKDLDPLRDESCLLGCGGKHGRIWKVKGRAVFQGDMYLFKQYIGKMRTAAALYWSQQASGDPLYEYLLKPPVTVLEEVHEAS